MLCGVEQMVQDLSDGSNDDEGSGAGCCWCCCVKPGTVFQCRVQLLYAVCLHFVVVPVSRLCISWCCCALLADLV